MRIPCPCCMGIGEIRIIFGSEGSCWVTCHICKGNKVVTSNDGKQKCKTCGGSGKIYEDCGPHEVACRACTDCTAAAAWPKPIDVKKPELAILRAETILERALAAVRQRGKDYDKPQGERSFHEIAKRTGMSPSKACEFLMELKKVRLDTTNWTHEDSLIDLQAYFALWIELKQEEARQ